MTLYKGNKQFKRLYKGGEKLVQLYKGDEKIFEDKEALYSWKFTIDTRMTPQGTQTGTSKDFKLMRYGYNLPTSADRPDLTIRVEWGDGTEDTVLLTESGITHTYPEAGVYQITIHPTVFVNGLPRKGWLVGVPASAYTQATDTSSQMSKVISIDKPFPKRSIQVRGSAQSGDGVFVRDLGAFMAWRPNLQSAPENLFDNLEIDASNRYNMCNFAGTFANCGRNTNFDTFGFAKRLFALVTNLPNDAVNSSGMFSNCFYGVANAQRRIPADLFSALHLDTSGWKRFDNMFGRTFADCPNADYIPEGLFPTIDTSEGTDFSSMFRQTFKSFGNTAQGSLTIPANLFSFVNTDEGKTFNGMFFETFESFGNRDPNLVIPSGLFSFLSMAKATSIGGSNNGMFQGTFKQFAKASTVATIPAGLFSKVTTPLASNFAQVFQETFSWSFRASQEFDIPEGLFDNLDTSNGTNFSGMFNSTFYYAGSGLSDATVPATLFQSVNTASGTDLSVMFRSTFHSMGSAKFNLNIPDGLFSHLSTANCKNFSNMFNSTFSGIGQYGSALRMTIPATLFSSLDTSGGTNFNGMFLSTFSGSYIETIPATLFSSLDFSSGTDFSSLFCETFMSNRLTQSPPATLFDCVGTMSGGNMTKLFSRTFESATDSSYVVPGGIDLTGLFDNLDTSNATNCESIFQATFSQMSPRSTISIPANMFQGVVLSGKNAKQAFYTTFYNCNLVKIPQGILGGLGISSANNTDSIFYYTFNSAVSAYTGWSGVNTIVEDPFDGMTDFTWVDASSAPTKLYATFASTSSTAYEHSVGTAASILAHFNFTPTTTAQTFRNRTGLSDYATIPTNWK